MAYWMRCLLGLLGIFCMAVQGGADEINVMPSVAVRGDYTDNLFLSYTDEQEDYVTTVTAGLEFLDRTERGTLRLDGAVAPFFYRDRSELNETDMDVLAEAGYRVTPRLQADLEGFFSIDNRPDRDLPSTGLVFGTDERYRYHGGAGAEYALHENHSLSASYDYDQDDWRTGENDPDRQDFEGHTIGLRYQYDISRWLAAAQLLMDAGYGIYDYETADLESAYAAVGLQRMLSEVFRFSATIGTRYVESEFPVQQATLIAPGIIALNDFTLQNDEWGGIASAGVAYLGERTRWNATASYDLRTAGSTQGASYLGRLIFHLTYRLLEKLAVGIFTGFYTNQADAGEFSDNAQDTATFNVRPFVRWRFWDDVSLEGAYQYIRIEDDEIDDSAQSNTVYLELRYGVDLWD